MPKALRDARILLVVIISFVTIIAARRYQEWQLEILIAGGFIIFAMVLWKILALYLNANTYEEKKDFVDVHAKIIGGAALIVSLIFTWQGLKLNQTSSETTQRLSLLTLQDTERRQIEDRLNRALEQLGSEKREARLGAIYSLGKIANDSIELKSKFDSMNLSTKPGNEEMALFETPTDFHWTIMQTLASYVRGNAASNGENSQSTKQVQPDIQAALNVLGWRKRIYGHGEDQRLELYQTDLRGLILKEKEGLPEASAKEGAHLEGMQLWEVDLSGANLRGVHLEDAILDRSSLKNAKLDGAHFSITTGLQDTDLEGADLHAASGLTLVHIKIAKNWEKAKNLPDNVQKELTSANGQKKGP
jgi:uncharacterized protein YjbI with pentapeptide repeats